MAFIFWIFVALLDRNAKVQLNVGVKTWSGNRTEPWQEVPVCLLAGAKEY